MYLSTSYSINIITTFAFWAISWSPSLASTGPLSLDSTNFDKVVSKFKATLIKFDIPYPYGEKDEEFGKVAQVLKNDDILVAEVGIYEYGDKQNLDIAERFGIKKDDFPVVKLFYGNDIENPITFPSSEEFKADNLKRFLKKQTGMQVLLNKCLKEFDDLAINFMKPDTTNEMRTDLLNEAKKQSEQLVKEEEKKSADVYIKLMEKVIERGTLFIKSEQERVKNLIAGKLNESKKTEMQARLNILESFMETTTSAQDREEL